MHRFRRCPQIAAVGMLPWLATLPGAAALVGIGLHRDTWWIVALGVVLAVAAVVGIGMAWWVRYEVDAFELRIIHGPRVTRIALECIEGILPTRRFPFLPPTSVETLTVVYQKDGKPRGVLVAPERADDFVAVVAATAPFLEKRGDRAIKKPSLRP